jgi:DNA polymerase-3 subunit gamma/tau
MTEEAALKNYKPLYLKYRPQSLTELVGQVAAARTLTNAIECDRLSHAYLFTGPRGTGKTSTARILAKSLNCAEGPTTTPCGKCTQCLEIKEGTCTAVFELDAASNNSVDDARVLIERAPLVAVGGRFKIYIIDECHMLTKEAFNALLKTIEEPPPGVVFVLATTEEHKVPQTIISRCQKLMFRLVSGEELAVYLKKLAQLEKIEIDDEALSLIARRSGGGLRDALGLLDQASLLSAPGRPVSVNDLLNLLGAVHEDALIEISGHVLNREGDKVLQSANGLLLEGREPAVVAQELALHFLNLTKASYILAGDPEASTAIKKLIVGSPKYLAELVKQAPLFERAELAQMVEKLNQLENTCRRTTQPALHLEMGLLSLCHRHDILIVKEMDARIRELELAVSEGTGLMPAGAGSATHKPAANTNQKAAQETPRYGTASSGNTASTPATSASPTAAVQQPNNATESKKIAEKQHQANIVSESTTSIDNRGDLARPVGDEFAITMQSKAPSAEIGHAAIPAAATEQSQTPATKPEAKPQASSDEVSPFDLEVAWEQLMESLSTRHTPTFSLLTQHAFPVSLTSKELTVGIYAGHFQKLLEDKVVHIKSAADNILGRAVAVKIKVMSKDAARPQASARASQKPAAKEEVARGSDDDEAEPATPGQATIPTPAPTASASIQTTTAATTAPQPAVTTYSSDNLAGSLSGGTHDPGLIKEAYKLFDGPGSRHIT